MANVANPFHVVGISPRSRGGITYSAVTSLDASTSSTSHGVRVIDSTSGISRDIKLWEHTDDFAGVQLLGGGVVANTEPRLAGEYHVIHFRPPAYGHFARSRTTEKSGIAITSFHPETVRAVADKSVLAAIFGLPRMETPLPIQFVEAWREMESYKELSDGWDGPNSIKPTIQRIQSAQKFLGLLPPDIRTPEAMASADGTVGWFWRNKNIHAAVEFVAQYKYSYFARTSDKTKVARGKLTFDGVSVPSDLLDIIRVA
ncbi:MAG: hypothetical protein PBV01_21045 [Brucella anthropi]